VLWAAIGTTLAWPYLTVTAGVLLVTQLASFIPAHRAAKLDVQKTLTSA
jgi:ABC-type lipoprotein release transport system permease subunit